ncbi:hypothetical protein BJ742DRAFT_758981 [Cladochytrium replicatum]|nr:hypothetical protein BJ742DRAFT_758981 [Cladochytrium replicatum]
MREVGMEPKSGPANSHNDDVNHRFQSPALVRHQLLLQLTQNDSSKQSSSSSKSNGKPTKENSSRKADEGRADIRSRNMSTILSVLPPDQITSNWSPGSHKNEEMRRTVSGKMEKVLSRFMNNGNGKPPTSSTSPAPKPTSHGKSQSQSSGQKLLTHQRKTSVPDRSTAPEASPAPPHSFLTDTKYKTERRPVSVSEPPVDFPSLTWNNKQNSGYPRQIHDGSGPVRSSEKASILAQRKSATFGKSRRSEMVLGLRKIRSIDAMAPISEHGWEENVKHPMKKQSVQSLKAVVMSTDRTLVEQNFAGSSTTVPIRPSRVSPLDDYAGAPVPVTVLGDEDDEPIMPATYVTAVVAAAAEDDRTSRVSSQPVQENRQPSVFVEPPKNEESDIYSDDDDSGLDKRDGALKIEELQTQDEGLKVRVAALEEQLSQALSELARARNECVKAVRERDDAKAGWMTEATFKTQAEKWSANLKQRLENAEGLRDMLHESEREREARGGLIQHFREENERLRIALDLTKKEASLMLDASMKEAESRAAATLREFEGRAAAMNDQLQRKDSEIKALQDQIEGVAAQRDRLQIELNESRSRAEEHIGKVQQLQNNLEELSLDAQHKEEQCRELQAQLEKTNHEFRLFEKRIHQFQDALQSKNNQIDQLSAQLRHYQLGFASTGETKRDSGLGSAYYPSRSSADTHTVPEFEYQGTPQPSRTQYSTTPVGSKTSPSTQRSWDSQQDTRVVNAAPATRPVNDKRNPFAPTMQQESSARSSTAPPTTPQVTHSRPTSSTGKSNLKSHNVSSQIAAVLGGGGAGDVQSPLKSKQSASPLGVFARTEERYRDEEYEYNSTKTPQRRHQGPQQAGEISDEDYWRDMLSRGDYQSVSKQIDLLTNEIKRLESMRSRKLHIRERERIEEEYESKDKQRSLLKMLIKREYGGPMLL